MRGKLVAILFVLILLLAGLPNAMSSDSIRYDKKKTSSGLPDLVCKLEIIKSKFDGYYHVKYSIENIGDAPTKDWLIKISVYPFGVMLLYHLGFDPEHKYLHYIIMYLSALYFHVLLFKLMEEYMKSTGYVLYPGKNLTFISIFPIYFGTKEELVGNLKIGFVIEGVADPDDKVEESDEHNNREVLRWWFPAVTKPPSTEKNLRNYSMITGTSSIESAV
ncbi:MAG TPA: hypothetical protein ENI44_03100, partial [Thermoplasmatales archaeon]|nr:hypothetical protein [Thermoplasmatales archaeon]